MELVQGRKPLLMYSMRMRSAISLHEFHQSSNEALVWRHQRYTGTTETVDSRRIGDSHGSRIYAQGIFSV